MCRASHAARHVKQTLLTELKMFGQNQNRPDKIKTFRKELKPSGFKTVRTDFKPSGENKTAWTELKPSGQN